MFKVNANLFRLAALVQSTEVSRYYLQGVCVEKHPHLPGALLTATNGHQLITIHDASAQVNDLDPTIVRLDKPALAACKSPRNKPERVLAFGEYAAPVEIRDVEGLTLALSHNWYVDGTFPNWRRVMPSDCSPSLFTFNASLLTPFITVAKALSAKGDMLIETSKDSNSPARILFAEPHILGVLMPLSSNIKPGSPVFLQPDPVADTDTTST